MTWTTSLNVVSAPRTAVSVPRKAFRAMLRLATIIFQTNQNEQHGGQAIPAFDFFHGERCDPSHSTSIWLPFINFYMIDGKRGAESEEKDYPYG